MSDERSKAASPETPLIVGSAGTNMWGDGLLVTREMRDDMAAIDLLAEPDPSIWAARAARREHLAALGLVALIAAHESDPADWIAEEELARRLCEIGRPVVHGGNIWWGHADSDGDPVVESCGLPLLTAEECDAHAKR